MSIIIATQWQEEPTSNGGKIIKGINSSAISRLWNSGGIVKYAKK